MLTRRQFMRRGSLLAAGGLALPPWMCWLSEQIEKLQPKKHVFIRRAFGLQPVPGQPGVFRDAATGQLIGIRDFVERDKYDTIALSKEHGFTYDTWPENAVWYVENDAYHTALAEQLKEKLGGGEYRIEHFIHDECIIEKLG